MALLVHNIRLDLDEPESRLKVWAGRALGISAGEIRSLVIARKSLDARPRHLGWVYSLVVEVAEGEAKLLKKLPANQVQAYQPLRGPEIRPGTEPTDGPPLIVGAGPAGLFAALHLARAGYRPVVLDRGQGVDRRGEDIDALIQTRRLNPESNLLFGEGGAGTYSDGKLYTRTRAGLSAWVVEQFAELADDEEIVLSGRPHVGSDRLPDVARYLREQIESLGGQVRYGARVDDLELAAGRVRTLTLAGGERLAVSCVILAVGHSARDTFRLLAARGVALSAKPFQMGLRIEHPQTLIDRSQLGKHADREDLPVMDYHLVARKAGGDRDVYTFCMCPGGRVLPATSQTGAISTNGGSRRNRRSGWANAGVVTTVRPEEFGHDPLAGLGLQERIERLCFLAAGADYSVCAQRVGDFLAGRASTGQIDTSSLTGARACDFAALLPEGITRALARALPMFERRIEGFTGPAAVLLGPETRASSPVRLDRDQTTRASVSADNLYPVGEGAGYAGGIVSAAVDGLRTAETVIARYALTK